jgi:formiminotetrahydrofolate cyclodeaminase
MALNAVSDALDELVREGEGPRGGAVAGALIATAAAMTQSAARRSLELWAEAAGASAQALALRRRALALARDDALAFAVARAALGGSDDAGTAVLLDRAAALPAEIAAVGADTTALAALVARHGDPDMRADVVAAATLAAAAARVAAHLVEVNLATLPADRRLERARSDAATAEHVRDEVLAELS